MARSSKFILSASERLFRLLLVVYPQAFRSRYGPQMTQVFLDCCRAAYQKGGTPGILRLWIPTLGDLLVNAVAEHISTIKRRLRSQRACFNVQGELILQEQGGTMLHITNGDSAGGTLRQTDLLGDVLTWKAYCSPDPQKLEAFLQQDTSALPFLKAALLRHLEQFPALQSGLSRTERQILEVIASGVHTPFEIFRAAQEKEESPFMGDSPFWFYLLSLCAGKKPLLKRADGGSFTLPAGDSHDAAFRDQQLVLTGAGKKALAGQTDWIKINRGIDRWLGGVHLQGKNAAWRWDTQRAALVQVQGAA